MFSLEGWIAQNFEVADGLLTNDEIRMAVKWMKCGKALGPSQFRGDMVQQWVHDDRCSMLWQVGRVVPKDYLDV
jgi:hypothetical protein